MEKILKEYPNTIIQNTHILIDLFDDNNICIQFNLFDINLSHVLNNEDLTYFLRKLIMFIEENYLEEINKTTEDKILNILEALKNKYSKN